MEQGAVVITSGGVSSYANIYHIVLGKYKRKITEGLIKKIVLEVLQDANSKGLKSVGIPPIGTGGNHTPMKICVRAMLSAIEEYGIQFKNPKCKKIEICIFDEVVYENFKKEYQIYANSEELDSGSEDGKSNGGNK